ncbi:MAG: hypothetical protein Kow0010_24300 [Dehalococcoidia bacterium]
MSADGTPPRVVTLYTRKGCTLCTQAEQLLQPIAARHGYTVELVDIEQDEALLRRYLFEVPVVAIEGREVATGNVTRAHLEDAFEGLQARD